MTLLPMRPSPATDRSPETRRFRAAALHGLRRPHKRLPAKYFYDELGSQLFDQICELDEYYLTRAELAIMCESAGDMAATLGPDCLLVEYGSGSSTKTRLLLDQLEQPAAYVPIDISREHLFRTARQLAAAYPTVDVLPVCADFTKPFELPEVCPPATRTVVYFPGSTIGNFRPREARDLLTRIARLCGPDGGLLIGVDLKKDPLILNRAYNDRHEVTAAFNLNVLARINRELGADFQLDAFQHHAFYNSRLGRVEMHLVSRWPQTVHLAGEELPFAEGESIHTECSYKYGIEEFRGMAADAGFDVKKVWTDDRRLFSVQYLRAR